MVNVVETPPRRGESNATEWRSWNYNNRLADTAYVDTVTGTGISGRGEAISCHPRGDLTAADLLAGLPRGTRRVYTCGSRVGVTPDGTRTWALAARLPEGWKPAPAGHYLDDPEFPVSRWRHPDGYDVDVRRIQCWLDGDPTPRQAREAMDALDRHARLVLNGDPRYGAPMIETHQATMLGSPAGTGPRWWRSGLRYGQSYPVLTQDQQVLIRATTTQGRVEPLDGPRPDGLPCGELVVFDRRIAYAAHCQKVSHGPATHVQADDGYPLGFEPYRRGRYRIIGQVPDGWHHVGLVAVKSDDGQTWRYPNRPGERFGLDQERPVWVDGIELKLLADWGWKFVVLEALFFAERQRDPLGPWSKKILRGRAEALADPDLTPEVAALEASGWRNVLVQSIGAFYAGARRVTRYAPLTDAAKVPGRLCPQRLHLPTGDVLMWTAWEQPRDPDLCHPEFPARIWRANNAALLDGPGQTGALHIAYDAEDATRRRVPLWRAFRTDAIWMDVSDTIPAPRWPDEGRPGQYRPKARIRGQVPTRWVDALAALEAA